MKSKFRKLGLLVFMFLLISCQSKSKEEEQIIVNYEVPSHLSKRSTVYYLISHGDTQNDHLTDETELNEKGFEQAAFWGNYFSDKELDLFYTSPQTFSFQTMIPIVHPYKGRVRNLNDQFDFNENFWSETYGKNTLVVSLDKKNKSFVNQLLGYNKYELQDLNEQPSMLKVIVDEKRRVKDTLIKF